MNTIEGGRERAGAGETDRPSAVLPTRKLQLDFIDGIRALLALYIVVHHALQFVQTLPRALSVFGYGQPVVAMFLTVSGFCLALPQASRGVWVIDSASFYRRRARRILPPYYLALGLAILVSAGYAVLGPFHDAVGEFSAAAVWSHVLLIQNWIPQQMYTLNGAMWSIALECQIYLFFPLLVVLRRRWGWVAFLAITAAVGIGGFRLFNGNGLTHFLLLFAIGVLSAEIGFGQKRQWLMLGMIVVPAAVAIMLPHPTTPQQEVLASTACAGALAFLCHNPSSSIRRALGCRPLAWVGLFSYSIYLIHGIVLFPVWYWVRNRWPMFGSHFDASYVLVMLATSSAAVLISYCFHIVAERPFMSEKRKQTEERLAV